MPTSREIFVRMRVCKWSSQYSGALGACRGQHVTDLKPLVTIHEVAAHAQEKLRLARRHQIHPRGNPTCKYGFMSWGTAARAIIPKAAFELAEKVGRQTPNEDFCRVRVSDKYSEYVLFGQHSPGHVGCAAVFAAVCARPLRE
jgi:hypothetical protein